MNQPAFLPAGVHERDASAWQGAHHRYPETEVDHATDLPLHAWLGRFTGNVSPAALALKWPAHPARWCCATAWPN